MFGFLLKIIVFLGIVVLLLFFVIPKLNKSSPGLSLKNLTRVRDINIADATKKISQTLDNLITHGGTSPVVLGVKITDTSLDTLVNLVRNLPPDQLNQLKSFVCQPAATSSAK